ncbi:hypothetical protein HID58_065187 [Brassica napus]|uniref:Uncharacterized protein n=1 Tax=Brassica napus TaxID=3708 RepID=A0ABQ7ZCI2_BRANA|nr:hypothetical protein HID58_065187 [Brassica napus]
MLFHVTAEGGAFFAMQKVPLPSSIPAKFGGGTQKKMELRKAKLEGEQQLLFDQATTDKLRSEALMIGWSMELKWQIVVRWLKQRDELFICFSRRSICRMQQMIYNEIFKGNMTKKLDAYSLLKIDPTKYIYIELEARISLSYKKLLLQVNYFPSRNL